MPRGYPCCLNLPKARSVVVIKFYDLSYRLFYAKVHYLFFSKGEIPRSTFSLPGIDELLQSVQQKTLQKAIRLRIFLVQSQVLNLVFKFASSIRQRKIFQTFRSFHVCGSYCDQVVVPGPNMKPVMADQWKATAAMDEPTQAPEIAVNRKSG